LRAANVFNFALCALVATAGSATIGVVSLCAGHLAPWTDYANIWLTWWLGDSTGAIIFAPFILLWSAPAGTRPNRTNVLELLALVAAVVFTGEVLFSARSRISTGHEPLGFLCVPLVIWAGLRFGHRVTSSVMIALSTWAVWETVRGFGPFVSATPNYSLLVVH